MNNSITKSLALICGGIMTTVACNGRPTYDVSVADFETTCAGGAKVRVEHDPDPWERRVTVVEGYGEDVKSGKIRAIVDDGHGLLFTLDSNIVCPIERGRSSAPCYSTKAGETLTPPCHGSLQVVEFKMPTHPGGYNRPLAEAQDP